MRKAFTLLVIVLMMMLSVEVALAAIVKDIPPTASSTKPKCDENNPPSKNCDKEDQSKEPEEKKCEKDQISKPKEPWETKDSLPEFKDYKELLQTGGKKAQKPIEVCAYNDGCKEVDKKFKDYYDECLKKCENVKTESIPLGGTPPQVKVTSTATGDSGKQYPDTKTGPLSMQSALEQQTKQKAIKDCKDPQGEQKHCTKKAGDKTNEDGKKKTEEKQKPGQIPKGTDLTKKQSIDCAALIVKSANLVDLNKLTVDQINDAIPGGQLNQIGSAFSSLGGGLNEKQQYCLGQKDVAKAKQWAQGVGAKNFDPSCFGDKAKDVTNELNKDDPGKQMESCFAGCDCSSGAGATGGAVYGSRISGMATTLPSMPGVTPPVALPANPVAAAGKPGCSDPGSTPSREQTAKKESPLPKDPAERAQHLKDMEDSAKATFAGQGEAQIKAAQIGADAQVKAAGIQAAASVMSALIGAAAQLAGQKDSGGQQSQTEAKAPDTGATTDLNQMPPGAVAELTPNCVGLVAPTETQIIACEKAGFKINGGVIAPNPTATSSNENKAGGPNVIVPVGGVPGTTVEQLVSLPPGGVAETTIGPALGGKDVTAAVVASPVRIREVISEGVVVNDFRTATVARYPSAASAYRPPLINWFTGKSVWGDMPALWDVYVPKGKPEATLNYQMGGASDRPPAQTVNIGQLSTDIVKVVPNVDDMMIDLKGTDFDRITTIIHNGIFKGSAEAAGLINVGALAAKKYLLQSPTGGASYIVTGPYVRVQDGGKIIQSSKRVGPDTLTPQQCEMVYGGPCQ